MRCCRSRCERARAAEVRDGGRGGRERRPARGQHRALALRRPGADGGHRSSARQADPGARPAIRAVVVHPHMFLATRKARAILKRSVELSDFVWQTANLAGFISGCYTDDLDMIRDSFEDVVIEPQRQALIPGFHEVRRAAMAAGALGCSISGAGPTMFAWAREDVAPAVRAAMQREFARHSLAERRLDRRRRARRRAGARRERAAGGAAALRTARAGARRPLRLRARRCCRDWRRTAGSTCRASWPQLRRRPSTVRSSWRPWRARLLAPVRRRRRAGAAAGGRSLSEAFNFPAPLVPPERRWAPGGARAVPRPDRGVQGLRRALSGRPASRACAPRRRAPLTILVATSGDTGGAVAAAFHRRRGMRVVVLFPKGLVSPTQEQQLTCWGDNVRALAVRGSFDDCQRLVKEAFLDPALRARDAAVVRQQHQSRPPAAAERLLRGDQPCGAAPHGEPASFIIPSGNLGNALACLWARATGPADRATSCWRTTPTARVPDYLESGEWQPRPSIADAGLGDGRGQSQQHGAPAARCFRRCASCARR